MSRSKKERSSHWKDATTSLQSPSRRATRSSAIDPNDLELAELLHQRDPQALTYLLDYAGRIETIIWRKFGGFIPKEDLQDIVADAILDGYRRGAEYDPRLSSISTWLSLLGSYKALRYLRVKKHFASQTLDDIAELLGSQIEQNTVPPTEGPSVRMEAALRKLSPQRAIAIRMHYYDGISFEQIAHEMGISTVSVRSLLSRGRDDLRELLEDIGCDDT